MTETAPVMLYSRLDDGHRRAFVTLFATLLNGRRASASEVLVARGPALFLMIEEAFALYLLACMLRATIGRKTVGFLFRPGPAVSGTSFRMRFKRTVLKLLRYVPGCTTLTIVPFSVEPRFAEVANGWIDDPQQWDLSDSELAVVEELRGRPSGLTKRVLDTAAGRGVVVALGRLDHDKGFDQMASIYCRNDSVRDDWLFVAGGQVANGSATAAREFAAAGGVLLDRRLSDDELLELYAAADLMWCCYSPTYDQSSGILGRAAQLAVPAVIRESSLLQRICEEGGIDYVALNSDFVPLHRSTTTRADGRKLRDRMRERSIARLLGALGVSEPAGSNARD